MSSTVPRADGPRQCEAIIVRTYYCAAYTSVPSTSYTTTGTSGTDTTWDEIVASQDSGLFNLTGSNLSYLNSALGLTEPIPSGHTIQLPNITVAPFANMYVTATACKELKQ